MKISAEIKMIGGDSRRKGFDFSKSKYYSSIAYADGYESGYDVRVYPEDDYKEDSVEGVYNVRMEFLSGDSAKVIFKPGVMFRLWELGYFATGEVKSVW